MSLPKRLMTRHLPKTLWGRTTLLVVSVVLMTLVFTLSLLAHYRLKIIREQGLELARGYLVMTRTMLSTMPPEQLALRLQQQATAFPNTAAPIRLLYQPAMHPVPARETVGVALLYRHLRNQWGDHEVRLSANPQPALLLRVQGDWWLQMLTVPSEHVQWWANLLPKLVLATLLLSALVAAFVWHLVKPLLRLQQHVAQFSPSSAIDAAAMPLLLPQAPQEIQVLAQKIDQMMADLQQHERERKTMLGGLPHDLRTPLTRLRLRLALMDEQSYQQIAQDVAAIEHITEQFISYLRGLEQTDLQRELFSGHEWLYSVVEREQAVGHDVRLQLPSETVLLYADPMMLQRVLDNVLSNARHHGAEPIYIQLTADCLIIDDSGQGIPPDQRQQAQEPFKQLAGQRGTAGQVGLGLAVIKQILAAHQIKWSLDDSPTGGLRIKIDLASIIAKAD